MHTPQKFHIWSSEHSPAFRANRYSSASCTRYTSMRASAPQQLQTPASLPRTTAVPLPTQTPQSTTMGPPNPNLQPQPRKALESLVANPSALYVKTKRRFRYTIRFKARVLTSGSSLIQTTA
ncbi:hypothetical protein FPQ18DRAFT_389711 [Pyronema domesticum]|nr:hypothetical protein FPQ18DRAFT_389711 [Pyronema domesticum]